MSLDISHDQLILFISLLTDVNEHSDMQFFQHDASWQLVNVKEIQIFQIDNAGVLPHLWQQANLNGI